MSGIHENAYFKQWLELRESYKRAKREKDYKSIITVSGKIIDLSKRAPQIGIMVALFERDTAEAYLKLDNVPSAVAFFTTAIKSFENYRAKEKLHDPDSFLGDIEKLQKKLDKLENKK